MLFAAAALLTSGCGFHLRSWDFSDTDFSVHVQSRSHEPAWTAPLRDALRQAGALASASADDADLVVQIVNESRNRRVASLTAGARAAEFELTMGVQFGHPGGVGQFGQARLDPGFKNLQH